MTQDNAPRAEVLEQLLAERHSCRGFRPEPVPRATVERILAIAQRTASWCNAQPWQLHVLSPEATERLRGELMAHARAHPPQPDFAFPASYEGVYLQRRRECGLQLYAATGVPRGDKAAYERQWLENYRLFGAPQLAIVSSHAPLGTYAAIDCGAYVHNFMLAAWSLGVASIAQAAQAAAAPFWRERLQLPEDRKVVCGIAFGYEDPAHPANAFRTSRAEVDEAVQWVD
ncbi:MAG TPA: nitroreductase [Ramlibacter sp.]|uniref:nitroreductase n=1 Tax=Ramlibacter sp. TaxID=1917967 RepID=UPI002D7F767B|nr:nitroreductase [Ramlibacter sp.]HET8744518.1 nitroreductase [Ramlibacter sp.]